MMNVLGSIVCWLISALLAVAFVDGITDIVPAMKSMSSTQMFYPLQAMLVVLSALFLFVGFLVRYRVTGPTPNKDHEHLALIGTGGCAAIFAIMCIPSVY